MMLRSIAVALLVLGCSSQPKMPVADGSMKVHDDLSFELTSGSRVEEAEPLQRYETREIVEPLGPGKTLRVRVVVKVLDEAERAALARDPNAISEIWPNSLELSPTKLVAHVTDRAWEAIEYDPSGLAHEDFEGGHSTYRTPHRVTLHVAFVHHGALVVLHSSLETEQASGDEAAVIAEHRPRLEQVLARLRR